MSLSLKTVFSFLQEKHDPQIQKVVDDYAARLNASPDVLWQMAQDLETAEGEGQEDLDEASTLDVQLQNVEKQLETIEKSVQQMYRAPDAGPNFKKAVEDLLNAIIAFQSAAENVHQ